jgi:nucleotide-binding universal stress UspA family protein
MPFKRILIAVDRTPLSVRAAGVGVELAAALGSDSAFVHGVEPMSSASSEIGLPSGELAQVVDDEAEDVFGTLFGSLAIPPSAQTFVRVGAPAQVVMQVAREWSAGLIVVGSHSRAGVERALHGSVADEISRHAPCPVLIVRSRP